MAEGIMKKLYGTGTYVQSVGVINDLEIDGFSIAVCDEIGVELSRHRSRSFDEMERWGGNSIMALTKKQKKLPLALQKAILKKQKQTNKKKRRK